jgi:hypothetical protein
MVAPSTSATAMAAWPRAGIGPEPAAGPTGVPALVEGEGVQISLDVQPPRRGGLGNAIHVLFFFDEVTEKFSSVRQKLHVALGSASSLSGQSESTTGWKPIPLLL